MMNVVPKIFIVGAPKAATSSLYGFLRRHPDVFMCNPKEPHFFSTDLPGLAEVKTREEYDALFADAPPGAHLGEASAFYLRSEEAAANIHAASPDARIVMSIRDPAAASISWYHQLRDGFREDQASFAASWNLQEARAAGKSLPAYCPEPAQLQYREIYSYTNQIARYFDVFGRDRVKVFLVEEIKANAAGVAAELLKFLSLPPLDNPPQIPQSNVRRTTVMPGLAQFLAAPPPPLRPLMGPVKRALNAVGLKPSQIFMKHLSRPAGTKPAPQVDAETRARVSAAFADDIKRLETLLDKDLSAWRG